MGLLGKIFGNTRKPEGFFGRLMVAGMNGGSHAAMAMWGLEIIDIPQTGDILDIGCGGGANIARLLARSKASKVTGVILPSPSRNPPRSMPMPSRMDVVRSGGPMWQRSRSVTLSSPL